ncbi:unnamed protein product [Brassica rapa]|uniref:Uncharacterized protein n=2 Tax=Brassica TaxID=3705 RepID=A0A8D9M4Y5_BRACM|nr:unnamed protein product [Brassica napus]CAG7898586.1 unnamed protein product [Brassica rapa]
MWFWCLLEKLCFCCVNASLTFSLFSRMLNENKC